MAVTNANLAETLANRIGRRGMALSKPATGSRTLRDSMRQFTATFGEKKATTQLRIPNYWAVMVNDGHKEIKQKEGGRMLMFYTKKGRDHRVANFPIVRLSDVNMTTSSWLSSRELTRRRKNGDIAFARSIPARIGRKFFDNDGAMRTLERDADAIAAKLLSQVMRQTMGELLNVKDVATGRI